MGIRGYTDNDREALLALWREVFPDDGAHNEASLVLDAKLQVDRLIFLAMDADILLGAMMAGYDGHRGWLYSVAVSPHARRAGTGSALVRHAIKALQALGCVKINLQVRSSNAPVVAFYEALGFSQEDRISMGLLLLDANGADGSS